VRVINIVFESDTIFTRAPLFNAYSLRVINDLIQSTQDESWVKRHNVYEYAKLSM